jgi:hypothetical protein
MYHDESNLAGMNLLTAARRLGHLINTVALSGTRLDSLEDQIENRFKNAFGKVDWAEARPLVSATFAYTWIALCAAMMITLLVFIILASCGVFKK